MDTTPGPSENRGRDRSRLSSVPDRNTLLSSQASLPVVDRRDAILSGGTAHEPARAESP